MTSTTKMPPSLLILVFLLLLAGNARAQYHLDEFGIMAGGGVTVPLGPKGFSPSYGLNGNFFFSHWICGKRYGYQGSLGFNHLNFNKSAPGGFLPYFEQNELGRLASTNVEAGFFFVLRKNEFHRRTETSFLLGPKLNILALAAHQFEGGSHTSGLNVGVNRFVPGFHLSARLKRRFLKKQSFFIQPGLDMFLLPHFEAVEGGIITLFPHLNLGASLWNSKQGRRNRG